MAPKGAGWKELVMFRIRLRAKDTTPLEPSPRENFSAVFRGHPLPKSKFVFAFTIMRLICTFHEELLSKNVPAKNQRMIVYSWRICQVLFPTATLQTYCRGSSE